MAENQVPNPTARKPQAPRLSRAALESLPRASLHRARNWSKASVCEVEWPPGSGRAVVVKDMRATPLWFRLTAGRFFVWREARALRVLRGVAGVPSLVARVDADALAMEKVPGRPLSAIAAGESEPQVLERIEKLLAVVHARGVTHCDLHAHNVMVADNGSVALIDWATASVFGARPSRFKSWSFEEWRSLDLRALAKIKVLHAPALISPGERDLLVNGGSTIYRAVKSVRRRLDKARGKTRGERAGLIESYIAEHQSAP